MCLSFDVASAYLARLAVWALAPVLIAEPLEPGLAPKGARSVAKLAKSFGIHTRPTESLGDFRYEFFPANRHRLFLIESESLSRHRYSPPGHVFCACVWIVVALAGCSSDDVAPVDDTKPKRPEPPASTIHFKNVAQEMGLDFVATNGEDKGHFAILESLGSGVGVIDVDLDGLLDVLCAGGGNFDKTPQATGRPMGVFRQRDSGKFDSIGADAHADSAEFYSHGISVADFDNDGFPDVLVTGFRGLMLLRNLGDGTFEDVAIERGLHAGETWPTSAAWADFDQDGLLDLYVVNYVDWSFDNHPPCTIQDHRDVCPPAQFNAQQDALFRANPDGTFTNVADEIGISSEGKGLAVVVADYDLDGDVDIYVANDGTANHMYRNDGAWKLTEVGLLGGTALGENSGTDGSMGADFGDFNLDGLPDLWVSNYESQTFALYRNDNHGHFQHVSSVLGINSIGASYVGFGAIFLDCDLDGDEDLLSTNGHVMYIATTAPKFQVPLVFENIEGKKFRNVATTAGKYFTETHMGRGLASGDYDNNGSPDLLISHTNQPTALLLNSKSGSSNVLQLELIGTASNRSAIGTVVTIRMANRVFMRQIKGGASYLSSQSTLITVGGLNEPIDSIEVRWPNGKTSVISQTSGNARHVILEGGTVPEKTLTWGTD